MSQPTQQFTEATQKNVEIIHDFMRTSLEGLEKLTKLNLDTSRKLIEEATESAKEISSARTPQELLDQFNQLATNSVENNICNCRDIFDVISETQAKITKMFESHFKHTHEHFSEALGALSDFNPTKSNLATESLKSWFNNANQAFSNIQKAASQVSEFTNNNLKAAATKTSKATTSHKTSKK